MMKNKIIITGAAGSIGSELSRQVEGDVLLLDQDETGLFNIANETGHKHIVADITDKNRIREIFDDFKPDMVYHVAAYKHVGMMEANIYEALKNNVHGTEIVADASIRSDVKKFIFVSTDKAVNPSSVMGTTKKIGEIIVRKLNKELKTEFIIVRFGNVKGSRGSAVPIFKEKIEKGLPITITHPDMERWFIEISEAVELTIKAAELGKRGDIMVLEMGRQIKIMDLAKEMIKESGKNIEIIIGKPCEGEKLKEELINSWEFIKRKEDKILILGE